MLELTQQNQKTNVLIIFKGIKIYIFSICREQASLRPSGAGFTRRASRTPHTVTAEI